MPQGDTPRQISPCLVHTGIHTPWPVHAGIHPYSRWYASYWNAFLFKLLLETHFDLNDWSMRYFDLRVWSRYCFELYVWITTRYIWITIKKSQCLCLKVLNNLCQHCRQYLRLKGYGLNLLILSANKNITKKDSLLVDWEELSTTDTLCLQWELCVITKSKGNEMNGLNSTWWNLMGNVYLYGYLCRYSCIL